MAIKESALSLITSITQSDWIRAVTRAGASRRITVADLAKAVGSVKVSETSVSSLPITISNAEITSTMEVVNSVLSNSSAQVGNWTVTTSNGSLTVSGSISGSTNITLYLSETR